MLGSLVLFTVELVVSLSHFRQHLREELINIAAGRWRV